MNTVNKIYRHLNTIMVKQSCLFAEDADKIETFLVAVWNTEREFQQLLKTPHAKQYLADICKQPKLARKCLLESYLLHSVRYLLRVFRKQL